MNILNLFVVIVLILLTSFFVAIEFSIVKIRPTRIDHLIAEGNRKAIHAKKLTDNLDVYLSTCQLGITITALGLGWIGESTIEAMLAPLFDILALNQTVTTVLSFIIAFFIITFLHVVVGELAPKTIAIQKAEVVTLLFAKPLIIFNKVLYPFIWLLNNAARLFIRVFGFKPVKEHEVAHSEEELRLIMSESYKSGEINQQEMMYLNNIFEFDDRLTKEIMVPRTEMVCFFKEDSFDTNIEIVHEGQYTRYPVAEQDKDHIIGLVNIKDIFTEHLDNNRRSLEPYIRPILHVSEMTPIKQVLLKMQKERIHMAVVIDEYGGTAGLVTVEDILEEIVGEIRDEFDANEKPMIEKINNETLIVDGKLLLTDINELLGTKLSSEEVDTIGGWIILKNVDVRKGTIIEHEKYKFIVIENDGYQIKKVKIVKIE